MLVPLASLAGWSPAILQFSQSFQLLGTGQDPVLWIGQLRSRQGYLIATEFSNDPSPSFSALGPSTNFVFSMAKTE